MHDDRLLPAVTSALKAPSAQRVFVGLGANQGDALATLEAALRALGELAETALVARSSFYGSAPIDAGGPDYVNAVAELHTALDPDQLLSQLHAIEAAHGRQRPYRNAPRTLDLDLLLYGDQRIDTVTLTVPHPRMHRRAFVLLPLAELAPGIAIRGIGPIADLLVGVADQRIDRLDP